jgi:hypothetical protein
MRIKIENTKEVITNQTIQKKKNSKNILFTNGSNTPEQGTAAAALLNNLKSSACRINNTKDQVIFMINGMYHSKCRKKLENMKETQKISCKKLI